MEAIILLSPIAAFAGGLIGGILGAIFTDTLRHLKDTYASAQYATRMIEISIIRKRYQFWAAVIVALYLVCGGVGIYITITRVSYGPMILMLVTNLILIPALFVVLSIKTQRRATRA